MLPCDASASLRLTAARPLPCNRGFSQAAMRKFTTICLKNKCQHVKTIKNNVSSNRISISPLYMYRRVEYSTNSICQTLSGKLDNIDIIFSYSGDLSGCILCQDEVSGI